MPSKVNTAKSEPKTKEIEDSVEEIEDSVELVESKADETKKAESTTKRRPIVPTATVLRIYNQCGLDDDDYNTFIRKLMNAGKYKTKAQAQERVRRVEGLLKSKYGAELKRLPGSKRLPKTADDLVKAFGGAVKVEA